MRAVNERILFLLKENGKTQKAMADAIGLSAGTVNGWLKKDYSIPVESAQKVAAFLGVSVEYLVTGESSAEPSRSPKERRLCQIFNSLEPHLQNRLISYGEGLETAQNDIRGKS